MHIKVKQFSLRNIVFSILLIVMLLLSCLAGTLLISTNQNRNLVNQYVSETVELYVSQFQKEMDVMRVELINILESNEATNELPDYFNSESSQVFPILKKISEQLRIQAIWHDSVYGYYEYIGTSNALITSTGTKFSKSVKTSTERFLMVYLSANMTRRQNSLYHEFVKIEDQMYLLTWYMKGQKIAGNLIPLQRIFEDLENCTKGYTILPYIYDTDNEDNIFPQNVSEEEIRDFEQGTVKQTNIYCYAISGLGDLCIYVVPGNGVLQVANRWEVILIIMLVICILVCVVVVLIYIRHILFPLQSFVNSLDELDTDTYLHDNSSNNLLELEFAQEQIRPHFFLNCISLIHGIADNKGETDIVTITSILSDYIRYIYKGSQVLRPLSEEIAHVENYISIQRFRYGEDYFQFDCMVDDGLGDIEIPVLLLQTLVENSFSHGLTPERKGEISLFITKEKHNDAECLYICVSDNGKGFSAEVLEKIENNGEIYYNDRRHVGLQNIKKRLNLIYGEQAEFHLSNMDENFGAISEVWITQQDKK